MPLKAISAAVFLIALSISPQKGVSQHMYMGLYGLRSCPLPSFKDAGYGSGTGFGFYFMSRNLLAKEQQTNFGLHAGGNFEMLYNGRKRFNDMLLDSSVGGGMARVTYANHNFALMPMARLTFQPWRRVVPYLEGGVGIRVFSSGIAITANKPKELQNAEASTKDNLISHATLWYGGTLGAMFRLGEGAYFDLGVGPYWGNSARFVQMGSLERNINEISSREIFHRPALLLWRVGFTFRIYPTSSPSSSDNSTTPHDNTAQPAQREPLRLAPNPPSKPGL